jgi:16S rRNA G966 N2-methylase RsmD
MEFPWRTYTDKELLDEYNRLRRLACTKKIVLPISFSTVGFKCNNYYFQYERMNTQGFNRPKTTDYWLKSMNKVKKFSKQQNRDLFSTLNFFNHSPSQFPIMTACILYRYFNATKILDPYAGWGDRCLAAMALDLDYVGIDSNKKLKKPYKKMIKKYPSKSKVKIYNKKSELILSSSELNKQNSPIKKSDFNLIFTSPPFWRKVGKKNISKSNTVWGGRADLLTTPIKLLEIYDGCECDYDKFMNESLIPLMKQFKNIWICLYIPNCMYNDLQKIFGNANKKIIFKTSNVRFANIYCWFITN